MVLELDRMEASLDSVSIFSYGTRKEQFKAISLITDYLFGSTYTVSEEVL